MPVFHLERIADRVIKYSFYLLFFLIPLIMTPWNYELFEYNKMMLTYALTTVIVGAWLAKMILQRRILFRRTPFDIPLLIFLIFQSLSLLFSIDRHTSFWGYYSRFQGGLLSTISYILLYYAFVSNFDKQKTLSAIRWTLFAAALVAAYGIAEHFGIDAQYWVQDVKNRVFSTLGQPNWLAAYLAALLPVSLALALVDMGQGTWDTRKYVSRIAYCVLPILFLLCLFYTKSRSGISAAFLTLGLFFFLLLFPKIFSLGIKVRLLVFLLGAILIFGGGFWTGKLFWQKNSQDLAYILGFTDQVKISPWQPQIGGTESADIRKIVWRGAVSIGKHYPLFGSGGETFAYSYYQFRPKEHNLVSEWDFLYNKAHNEYLNFWATTGMVGLGSYLLLIGWIVVWNLKNLKCQISDVKSTSKISKPPDKKILDLSFSFDFCVLTFALFAGWVSILITNFFGFSVVPVTLFFFLFPAFAVVISRKENETHSLNIPKTKYPRKYIQYAALLFVLFTIFYLLFTIMNYWRADVAFARADRLNKLGEYPQALESLKKALKLNPGEPNYHDELAWSAANLAVLAFEQKEATASSQFVNLAISSSNKALGISPFHLNFWKTRAKIFFKLTQIETQYLQKAHETLLAASQLAPTDAKIFYNLGLVQETLGLRNQAIQTLKETVKMKDNYLEARYALALFYKESGQTEQAIAQLEYILKNLSPGHPEATQKLKEWQSGR